MGKRKINVTRNFENKFIPEPNSGCWIWVACHNKKTGYGKFSIYQQYFLAHRAAYKIYKGEIPFGKCVLHHCDNPACVNPDHLFIGTHLDNMQDKHRKNRQFYHRGEQCNQAKLTEAKVRAIRADLRKDIEIAQDYGIAASTVKGIKIRFRWKHVL